MSIETIIGYVLSHYTDIGATIFAIIGLASALDAALRAVARVTPTDADDEFATRFTRALGQVRKLLDRVGLNPPADLARPPKRRQG